jgi:hypothetical protein
MKTEIILLFFINICSAIGYSLIAPLYPYEALKRDIKEKVCGFIISMFAVSNFFATPFCPALISKYGRKQIFYFAVIVEVISYSKFKKISYIGYMYLCLRTSVLYSWILLISIYISRFKICSWDRFLFFCYLR